MTTLAAVPVPADLARRLSRARQRSRDAEIDRERLIVEAVEVGGSLREVAELAGVSHQTVANIVKRRRP